MVRDAEDIRDLSELVKGYEPMRAVSNAQEDEKPDDFWAGSSDGNEEYAESGRMQQLKDNNGLIWRKDGHGPNLGMPICYEHAFCVDLEQAGFVAQRPWESDLSDWCAAAVKNRGLYAQILDFDANARANDLRFREYAYPWNDEIYKNTADAERGLENAMKGMYDWTIKDFHKSAKEEWEGMDTPVSKGGRVWYCEVAHADKVFPFSSTLMNYYMSVQLFNEKRFTNGLLFKNNSYDIQNNLVITSNEVTMLENSFISNDLINGKVENKDGHTSKWKQSYEPKFNRTRTIGEIFDIIMGGTLANISKDDRPQIYMSNSGYRPNNEQYMSWNGLQVIDLDLKNSPDAGSHEDAVRIKQELFDALKIYPWLAGIGLSSSKRGIHIYTKSQRPHPIYANGPTEGKEGAGLAEFYFKSSFIAKTAAVKYALEEICRIDVAWGQKKSVIDFAMGSISQGIKVADDPDFLVNGDFIDMHPLLWLSINPDKEASPSDWLLHEDITSHPYTVGVWEKNYGLDAAPKQATFAESIKSIRVGKNEYDAQCPPTIAGIAGDLRIPEMKLNYVLRYNVCNTLAFLFGEEGRAIAEHILCAERRSRRGEISAFMNTALNQEKGMSQIGISYLEACGIKISYKKEYAEAVSETARAEFMRKAREIANSTEAKNSAKYNLCLAENEYLGTHIDKILSKCRTDMPLTLISPPGTGKTEMIKKMSKIYKVLIVEPFTSVIESKFDNTIDRYYGTSRIPKSGLPKGRSCVMTLDKFSTLDPEVIMHMFDYVVIDESHLLFTSSYRDEVMAGVLTNINVMTNTSMGDAVAKVILMTGTPTGEISYLSHSNKLCDIKITKLTSRTKTAMVHLCGTSSDAAARGASYIADRIAAGAKIMIPSNDGEKDAAGITEMVRMALGDRGVLKCFYYKKQNSEKAGACNIIQNNTLGENNLIFASSYLSVGVDINDKHDIETVYIKGFCAADIEQFNNRFRNVDIKCSIFMPTLDSEGMTVKNLCLKKNKFNIGINLEGRRYFRDCSKMSVIKLAHSCIKDGIMHRIEIPGFVIRYGQAYFWVELYAVLEFEKRYKDVMNLPLCILSELKDFGYALEIIDEGMDNLGKIEALKDHGKEAKKEASYKEHEEALQIVEAALKNADGMAKSLHAGKMPEIIEDDDCEVGFVEKDGKPALMVRSVEAAEMVAPFLRNALRSYKPETAMEVFKLAFREGRHKKGEEARIKINKKELSAYTTLMQMSQDLDFDDKEASEPYRNALMGLKNISNGGERTLTQDELDNEIGGVLRRYCYEIGMGDITSEKMREDATMSLKTQFDMMYQTKRKRNGDATIVYRKLPKKDAQSNAHKSPEYQDDMKFLGCYIKETVPIFEEFHAV